MIPLSIILYAALAGLAVVLIVAADTFPGALSPRDLGPAAVPVAVAGAMLALIALDLAISWNRLRRVPARPVIRAIAAAVLMALVIWAAKTLGFFVVLPPALFLGLVLAGSRAWLANALFSLALPAAVWFVFDLILLIPISSL